MISDGEYLEVRWNELKDYDIHFKRFKRMGALLEWVEQNPMKVVSLAIYNKPQRRKNKDGEWMKKCKECGNELKGKGELKKGYCKSCYVDLQGIEESKGTNEDDI